jgi:hypothetical protein
MKIKIRLVSMIVRYQEINGSLLINVGISDFLE